MFGTFGHASLANRTGPHVKGGLGTAFAEFETRVIIVRNQYLQALEHYLMDVREPAIPFGAIWRYLCLVVANMWMDQDIGVVSVYCDIVAVALSAPMTDLCSRNAGVALARVAASSIEVDWLADAVQLHEASSVGSVGKGKNLGPPSPNPTPP